MLKKKTQFSIFGSVMVAILLLLIINSPLIAAGTIEPPVHNTGNGKQFADNSPPEKAIDSITERYLSVLGVNSSSCVSREVNAEKGSLSTFGIENITKCSKYTMNSKTGPNSMTVNDALTVFTGVNNGYEYTAQFLFNDGAKYTVTESETRTTIKNDVTTVTEQNLLGPINYSMISVEKKTIGEIVSKQNDVSIKLTNSSGSFEVKISGDSVWNKNESTILDATIIFDENIREPVGQYLIRLVPSNETTAKATITLPNGTVLDPGLYQFIDDSAFIYNYGYEASLYHLQGWIVYYTEQDQMNIELMAFYLGQLLFIYLEPVGIILGIIAACIIEIVFIQYDATDGNVYSYYESIFLEHWQWDYMYGWYCDSSEPYGGECGFWTNQIWYENKLYWAYYPTAGNWYPPEAHTGPWPGTGINYFTVTGIAQATAYGYGSIYNEGSMVGEIDGNLAQIYAPSWSADGSGGVIVGWVDYQAHGNIYVRCSVAGDSTHFYVYTSNNNNGDWVYKTDWLIPEYFDDWIYCSYSSGFNYICVVAIKQGSEAANLSVDCVAVID